MRTCRKCFEYLYLFVGGDVRCCPWNRLVVGNLLENTLEEVWHGPKMDEIRQAFMRGELLGCDEQYCPFCINDSDELQISEDEMKDKYNNLPDTPECISLAYDERCNHACPSCRHEFFNPDSEYKENLKKITANVAPYLGRVKRVITNGIGDLFVSHEILDMLSEFHPKRSDFSIFIETNGVLFKNSWEKLKHFSDYHMTVSITPNSFDRETYRYLAGRDDLEKFEESMQFITDLKHKGAINHIRIIMVIQDSNFRQIPEFIQKCIDYDADDIVLRPIYKWFGLQEDELLYKNVLNPCHPYYKEYLEIIENPICKDPRVFNWGFEVEQEAIEFPTLDMKRRICQFDALEQEIRQQVCCAKEQLKEMLSNGNHNHLIIYGVGRAGKIALQELTTGDETLPVSGFAVTKKDGNPKFYMGYPVNEIYELTEEKESAVVLIATTQQFQFEIKNTLKELGFEKVVSLGF